MLVAVGLTACLLCLVSTPLVRDAFLRMGKVDHPDDDRKFHAVATPRCGGIGIVLSWFAAMALAYFVQWHGSMLTGNVRLLLLAVLPATAAMFLVGLADDLLNLPARVKLAGQIVPAVVAVGFGVRLHLLHGPAWLGWALTLVWLLACTNAVNLIDGMDGLATGAGLTATLAMLVVALLTGNTGLAVATAALAGALLAFLRFNFSPASVFLGDSGSLTIGFLLGCLGLMWDTHAGLVGIVGPMMTLALPLLDVSLSISRRFLRHQPIFQGDRGHIHHRVLALGFGPRGAALLLYGCCLLSASLALLQTFARREVGVAVLALVLVLVLLGVKCLDYVEFRIARNSLSHRELRRAVKEQIYLEELRQALLDAATHEECWQLLQRTCNDLSFADTRLQLGSALHTRQAMMTSDANRCQLRVMLTDNTWLLLTAGASAETRRLTTLVQHVQAAVHQRTQAVPTADLTMNKVA